MEDIERLVLKQHVAWNALRVNVQEGMEKVRLPSGRMILKHPIQSQSFTSGPLYDAVHQMFPWANKITVNRNYGATPHRDGKNQGKSAIAFFGKFTGGALAIDEPGGVRKVSETRKWFFFNGARDRHWVEPFAGNRLSVIAYVH